MFNTANRLVRNHLVLAAVSALVYGTFCLIIPEDLLYRLSMATAYAAFLFLCVTLLTGPVNVLLQRSNPVSTNLRRDVGIWCGAVSLAHVAFGLQRHMGNMLLYFMRPEGADKHLVLRTDIFGVANYTGLIATLGIILLLALSNDLSLKRLGVKLWKLVQRWNYAVFALVVAHGILFQLIAKRQQPYPFVFGAMIALVVVIQVAAIFRRVKPGSSV